MDGWKEIGGVEINKGGNREGGRKEGSKEGGREDRSLHLL